MLKGKIITLPLVDQLLDENQENPSREMFQGAWDLFQLAVRLDPENEEAHDCIDNMKGIMETTNTSVKHEVNHSEPLDVIIVGAGASGVGVALMHRHECKDCHCSCNPCSAVVVVLGVVIFSISFDKKCTCQKLLAREQ